MARDSSLKLKTSAPIVTMAGPFQEFAARESSGGIVLLLCTVAALVWANSPWAASYSALWHTHFGVSLGGFVMDHDLHFWVNDALMAVFFFVVGLEIKRELLAGELASARQAALPMVAALGGVVIPAGIYAALNAGGPGLHGWGVPMATDIAFAIGVMALLGKRVPLGVKVFLTALAIVDDIAAVLVIAVFYTAQLQLSALAAAGVCLAALLTLNRLGARRPLPYALFGLALWFAVLQSGIHATIAGVLLAMTIPYRADVNTAELLQHGRAMLDRVERAAARERSVITDEEQQTAVDALEDACEKAQPPLQRLEETLHPWVTFLIMPVFALANAGVVFSGGFGESLSQRVTLGVILGLALGKPLGITLAAWLAVKLGLAALPLGVRWGHIHAAGWLGGIGFTMSLFIAGLAFTTDEMLALAKVGILVGSLLAGVVGSALLLRSGKAEAEPIRQDILTR